MVSEFTVFSTLAVHHLLIGTAMIVLLGLINKVTAISAEIKSWLWMTAFISATLLPISLIETSDEPAVSVKITERIEISDTATSQGVAPTSEVVIQPGADNVWHFPMEWIYFYGPLIYLFLGVWAVGSLWRARYLAGRVKYTRSIKKSAQSNPLTFSSPALKNVPVFVSDDIHSPMVIGIFRPCVVVPRKIAEQLSEELLVPVLLHEKAHISRYDTAFSFVQEVIAILFWWSPVIRIINHHLHISRELACDLRAAHSIDGHKAYAQSLLECARLMVKQKQNVLAMSLFSKKKELNYRVESVLQNTRRRIPNLATSLIACFALSLLTIKAAQSFTPKISVDDVEKDAKHYSLLSDYIGRALVDAVINQDIERIRAMQEEGVDIDTPARRNGTALMIAVRRNDATMVNALLDLGADPNQSSMGDGNPLIIAAQRNNLALATVLLERGAEVDMSVPRDETALINATRNGFLEMTQLLVENGADVNLSIRTGFSDGYKIRSPMSMARTQAIRDYLIQMGAQTEL